MKGRPDGHASLATDTTRSDSSSSRKTASPVEPSTTSPASGLAAHRAHAPRSRDSSNCSLRSKGVGIGAKTPPRSIRVIVDRRDAGMLYDEIQTEHEQKHCRGRAEETGAIRERA